MLGVEQREKRDCPSTKVPHTKRAAAVTYASVSPLPHLWYLIVKADSDGSNLLQNYEDMMFQKGLGCLGCGDASCKAADLEISEIGNSHNA